MDFLASFASPELKEAHARDQKARAEAAAAAAAAAEGSKEADSKLAAPGGLAEGKDAVDSKLADSKTGGGAGAGAGATGGEGKVAEAGEEKEAINYTVEDMLERLPKYHGEENELVNLAAMAPDEDPGFYDPARLCKELNILLENHDVLVEEMRAATNWNAWPETNLYNAAEGNDWNVVPFLHTFPATDPANSEWVETNCKQCPRTVALLKKLPGIRTALYSRMSPGTTLTPHTGWADLSNHVIRCHIPLVAEEGTSGVWVLGKVQFHKLTPKPEILVFDDAKIHLGYNLDPKRYRCVLIVDLMRPDWMAPGTAEGGMTEHLTAYIDRFREEVNRVKDPSETKPVKW